MAPDSLLDEFMRGGTMIALLGVALFFYRFARDSGDRFFSLFAGAFFLLGMNQILSVFLRQAEDQSPYTYLLRLVAFLMIIVAIVEKNLPRTGSNARTAGRQDGTISDETDNNECLESSD